VKQKNRQGRSRTHKAESNERGISLEPAVGDPKEHE
jgi:hypothetical protein